MTASAAPERRALWDAAGALSDAAGASASVRARRLAVRDDRAIGYSDLVGLPDWLRAPAPARARLARLTGAVLTARAWRSEISGAVLGRAARAVGDAALEDLINLPAVVAPEFPDPEAARGDERALDRLGAGALIAATQAGPGLTDRFARLFPDGVRGGQSPAAAALAQRTAESLSRQADAEPAP